MPKAADKALLEDLKRHCTRRGRAVVVIVVVVDKSSVCQASGISLGQWCPLKGGQEPLRPRHLHPPLECCRNHFLESDETISCSVDSESADDPILTCST